MHQLIDKRKLYFYLILLFILISVHNLNLVNTYNKTFDLKKIEFPLNIIKSLQFFKSQRWDIITRKDQTIKLPTSEYKKSLRNFLKFKNKGGNL